jgi:hypothetical protein
MNQDEEKEGTERKEAGGEWRKKQLW